MADEMTELEKLLRRKESDSLRAAIDVREKVAEWLTALDVFFAEIDEWLKPLKDQGLLRSDVAEYDVHEENLANYKAPGRQLTMGGRLIFLKPIGRFIIGSLGRVDVMTDLKHVMLLRQADGWKIAETHRRLIQTDFNKDRFAALLTQLVS